LTNSIRRANPADAQLTWKNAEARTRLSPRVVEVESGGPLHALVRCRDAAAWRAFVARRPAEIRRKVADARYLARHQHERAQITQICAPWSTMPGGRHLRQNGGYRMLRARRAVTVCDGTPAPGEASLVSGEPIAADRSRRGDHHRDIVNIAWDTAGPTRLLRAHLE